MALQTFRALVVDDDSIARRTVGFSLWQEDFNCAYATDGDDALNRLATENFDLVVTDLRMPNKHGHALAVELLSREQPPLIIIHSSIDDPRLTKDLLLKGVDDIVYKPTNYAAFAAKARALVLRRKRAATPAAQTDIDSLSVPAKVHVEPATRETFSTISSCPIRPILRAEYERRLQNVQHLFPLSTAAYEVFQLSNNYNTTSQELVATLSKDAALTADVIRLADCAYYSRNHASTIDVREAVVRIGFKKIGEIALALSAMGAFRSCILPWLDADLSQARSMAASIALERLRETCNQCATNHGMTLCALLHPLGRLVLGSAFQEEYKMFIRHSLDRKESLSELEVQVFPESHFAALGRVLTHWNVPNELCAPLFHLGEDYTSISRLDEPLRSQVELVKLAIFIGEIAIGRWSSWDQIEPPPAQLLKRYGLLGLGDLIKQTRTDLTQLIKRHKATGHQVGGVASQDKDQPVSRTSALLYCDLSSRNPDWMPLFLQSVGVSLDTLKIGKGGMVGGLIVDCLDAKPQDVIGAIGRKEWGNLTPLLMIPRHVEPDLVECGATMCLPASVGAIQAVVQRFGEIAKQPALQ